MFLQKNCGVFPFADAVAGPVRILHALLYNNCGVRPGDLARLYRYAAHHGQSSQLSEPGYLIQSLGLHSLTAPSDESYVSL